MTTDGEEIVALLTEIRDALTEQPKAATAIWERECKRQENRANLWRERCQKAEARHAELRADVDRYFTRIGPVEPGEQVSLTAVKGRLGSILVRDTERGGHEPV